ncbi:hypothetical protein ARMGADRAFT_1038399 [Armillaria gallica]|uniref:Uncharacterized protein n=1 Tax=Armillaria gallica TaxID=47427 RepID=A0A2H3CLH1_ARMGA|nr:hypothetical protein ARMGADRAFT_1038399 [Armillaria gallica]
MDTFYDENKAREALKMHVRESTERNEFHLNHIMNCDKISQIKLDDSNTRHVLKLIVPRGDGKESEEVVFTMNRIICHADLPPIFKVPKMTKDKPTILLQKVMIIGLRAMFFQEAMNELQEVNLIAEGEFHQGELETWAPTMFRGTLVMECTNQHLKKIMRRPQQRCDTISEEG